MTTAGWSPSLASSSACSAEGSQGSSPSRSQASTGGPSTTKYPEQGPGPVNHVAGLPCQPSRRLHKVDATVDASKAPWCPPASSTVASMSTSPFRSTSSTTTTTTTTEGVNDFETATAKITLALSLVG